MEVLDYLEVCAAEQVDVLRKAYDDLHERAYKFATLLIAGGGAVGVYALTEFGKAPGNLLGWAPIAGLALTWLGTAIVLLWSSVTARDVSAGPKIQSLKKRYQFELSIAGDDEGKAFKALREAALDRVPERVGVYVRACAARADRIDLAYRAAVVCSPSVPAIIVAACYWFRH